MKFIVASDEVYSIEAINRSQAWRKYAIHLLRMSGHKVTEESIQNTIEHRQDEDLMYDVSKVVVVSK